MARIIERRVFDVVNSVSGGEQEWRVVNHSMDHHPVPLVRPPPDNGRSATSSSTTIKMSRAPPYESGFALSLSMGRAAAPPNHGAATPQHHGEAASYRGRACCRWFAFGGGVEVTESKNRERGGALALGGCLLMKTRNNQMEDGFDVRGCD